MRILRVVVKIAIQMTESVLASMPESIPSPDLGTPINNEHNMGWLGVPTPFDDDTGPNSSSLVITDGCFLPVTACFVASYL